MRNDVAPTSVWVSVTRYCELYDLDRKTVYKYLGAGLLRSWQVGRVLRVRNVPPLPPTTERPSLP